MRGRTGLSYDLKSSSKAAARCLNEQFKTIDRSIRFDEALLFILIAAFVWHFVRHLDRRNRLRDVFYTLSQFGNIESQLKRTRDILAEKRLLAMQQVIEKASSIKIESEVLVQKMSTVEVLSDVKVSTSEIATDTVVSTNEVGTDTAVLTELENEIEKIEQLAMISIDIQVDIEDKEGLDDDDIDRIKQQQTQQEFDKLREEQLAAIEESMKQKLKEAEEIDTAEARELLARCTDFVGAISDQKIGLQAIRMRDIDKLKSIVDEIDRKALIIHLLGQYPDSAIARQLARDLENLRGRALLMIAKFEDIVRMREEIEKMNQSTIAEIRSFSDPPEFVRNVMAAVYTLLGEDRKDVKDWTKIRVLIGKIGKKALRRRILEFDMSSLEGKHALIKRAKMLINNHTLAEVKEVSVGASVFFSWCMVTIDTVETTW